MRVTRRSARGRIEAGGNGRRWQYNWLGRTRTQRLVDLGHGLLEEPAAVRVRPFPNGPAKSFGGRQLALDRSPTAGRHKCQDSRWTKSQDILRPFLLDEKLAYRLERGPKGRKLTECGFLLNKVTRNDVTSIKDTKLARRLTAAMKHLQE